MRLRPDQAQHQLDANITIVRRYLKKTTINLARGQNHVPPRGNPARRQPAIRKKHRAQKSAQHQKLTTVKTIFCSCS